jgi:peptidoglycan/LPS O-acetylase OafA/YrhL
MAIDLSPARPRVSPSEASPDAVPPTPGYLSMLDLFRVVVCASVLGQHSFLWTGMSNNIIGTGFITILHYTRDGFFVLSGFVVCYAQITRPRSLWGFWSRRYVQIGVPYLAWTAIYVVFTILRPGGSWSNWWTYLEGDLRLGYYQLYVVIVLLQFYVLFPLLLKLLRSTRHHLVILSISVAVSLFIGVDLHYNPHLGVVGHFVHQLSPKWLPWSRNLLSYQLYFIVGALVAFHLDRVLDFVQRRHRQILVASGAIGLATLLWYISSIWAGYSTGSASDIYQPIAVVWAVAASAGIFALSWMWFQRSSQSDSPKPSRRPGWLSWLSITYLAELTGGFYLCHILFINMIRAALYSGLIGGAHLPWPIRTAIFYVCTAVVAVAFVSLVVRTPLRWILGGPVRSEQKNRDNAELAQRSPAGVRAGPFGPFGSFGRTNDGDGRGDGDGDGRGDGDGDGRGDGDGDGPVAPTRADLSPRGLFAP